MDIDFVNDVSAAVCPLGTSRVKSFVNLLHETSELGLKRDQTHLWMKFCSVSCRRPCAEIWVHS